MNLLTSGAELERPAAAALAPVHPKYRADIDGLRAVAVLSVVVFHAFPQALRGGFIGVDIFFVISGFLISTIIMTNLERGSFSVADFYGRRVRRIFPVLLLVMAACYAWGWFSMMGDQYKQLGKHIAGGAGFVSNWVLWKEQGYFDLAAQTKPLLHLWSLGVEEQFYILWPALLWLAYRRGYHLLTLSLVLALVSFVINIKLIHKDPVGAFYAPHARFWQMLSGSALAWLTLHGRNLLGRHRPRADAWLGQVIYAPPRASGTLADTQSVLGALLIAGGVLTIHEDSVFPGWRALIPTLGAVLLIAAGSQAWFNRKVLTHPALVWLGLISFPLYLWHWPLLVFAGMFEVSGPDAALRVGVLAAALLLAWLSYRLLERPLRSGRNNQRKTTVLVSLMVLLALVGYDTYRRDGMSFRLKERQEFSDYFSNDPGTWNLFNRVGYPQKNHTECEFFDIASYRAGHITQVPRPAISANCYQRDPSRPKVVLIWGDSHAEHLSYGLRKNLPTNWQVLQVASSSCNPSLEAAGPSGDNQCIQSNWFALKTIQDVHPDVVLVGQNEGHSMANFRHLEAGLKALGVPRVVFTGPVPHWRASLPTLMMTDLWLTKPRYTTRGLKTDVVALDRELKAGFAGGDGSVVYLDIMDVFCRPEGCMTYLGADPKTGLTSFDYGHLMPEASDYLARQALVKAVTGT
ncbi:acyltransferase family protein [Pseudoduganella sp. FT26W]|uniref:Acyltransferase family protein n=1 Tax=Duganella aquatilis TaxID=2666082 RepID=A0A844D833_9BURK|nr:acyltransferase family protein [Duganella aquatilis]MRW87091.1 acyltransferase family protein [Duganella aquatilis]